MKKSNQFFMNCLLLVALLFQGNMLAQNNRQHLGRLDQSVPRSDTRTSNYCQWRQLGMENLVNQPLLGNFTTNSTQKRKIMTTKSGREIWGGLIYANSWNQLNQEEKEIPYQILSFSTDDPTSINTIKSDPYLNVNGGAAIYDGKIHFINIIAGMGFMIPRYCEMDIETWQHTDKSRPNDYLKDVSLGATTTVTDPKTGIVYGQFFANDGKGYEIGTINYDNLKRTMISYTETYFVASAMNSKGEWYGIGKDGYMYIIDKETGDIEQSFELGLEPCYVQGAIFDPDDDNLIYWASSFRDAPSALYTIDVAKEEVSLVGQFPDNEEITFMFIPETPEANAPAKAENVSANFVNESLQGEVSFTIPSMTYGGFALTGDVEWEIFANNVSMAKGTAVVSAKINETITVEGGNTFIKIVLNNVSGNSESAIINVWVGYDEPQMVNNLAASINDNKVSLSWETPEKGIHDGYVDVTNLKYNIKRCPDEVMVAENISETSFTDVLGELPYALYYYEITAVNSNMASKPAMTEKMSYGKAYDLPYNNPLATEDDFNVCAIVDNNHDGITWMFREDLDGVIYPYTSSGSGDDWLITPPVKMKNDRLYEINYDVRAHQYGYVESMNVYIMQGDDINNSTLIAEYPSIEEDFYIGYNNTITVANDGEYRIAYRAMSKEFMYGIHLANINITEGSLVEAPDSATNINIIAAELGKLSADIEFTAPSINCGKKTLNEITKIIVKNITTNKQVKVVENVTPGEKVVVTDTKAENGFNEYCIQAYNNSGKGIEAKAKGYVGMDTPDIVNNIQIYDNLDGTARLTWDVPSSVGIHGGYVDINDVNYTVTRYVYGEGTNYYAENIAERECIVDGIPTDGDQEIYSYSIYVNSNALKENNNTSITSPYVISGTPYSMPFFESFNGGNTDNSLWFITCKGSEWVRYSSDLSYDGIGGSACWTAANAGDIANLNSGKILPKGDNPKVVFMYYGKKADLMLNANIRVNGQTDNVLESIDFNNLGDDYGWYQCIIPIKQFNNSSYVEIRFNSVANEAGAEMAISNVELLNVLDHNLVCTLSATNKIAAGSIIPALVKVRNIGEYATSDYTVKLYADGKFIDKKAGVNVNSLETVEFNFDIPTNIAQSEDMKIYAEVEYAKDLDLKDNKSGENIVSFIRPTYPKVEDLMASTNTDGTVSLNWNAPSSTIQTETDGFEMYDPFVKGNYIGPWKTLDLDGAWTFTWDNIEFPGNMREMSYIVFNPYVANNMDLEDRHITMVPRNNEGAQYLICWDATYMSKEGNNDWLISPVLPEGNNLDISFYARSFNEDYGMEDFEVLYSMTGTEPEDFDIIETNLGAPASDWTLFEFKLPENARHFAIRCYSKYKVAFMLDDITYPVANLTLKGYNIYRDSKLIASVDENTTSYVDNTAFCDHSYQVTVVYSIGESDFSNMAVLSSIDNIGTNDIVVRGDNRCIRVFNAEGKDIKIYTTDGKMVCSGNGTANMNFYVNSGNYLVQIGKDTVKIAVK